MGHKEEKDLIKDNDMLKDNSGKDVEKNEDSFEQTLKLCGIGRNEALNTIVDLIKSDNPRVTVNEYNGEVHITVSSVREGDKGAKKIAKSVIKELKGRFSEKIYSTDEEGSLAGTLVELLKTNSLTIATAESLTGGLIAARIVDIPGASEVFKEGFVTYSNKSKRTRLGVKKSTLVKHGAVSEQTVKEMLKGTAFATKSDVCVASSGIAGPEGGSSEKPVGTVFIGCNIKGRITINEYRFRGSRNEIRERSVTEALTLVRLLILKEIYKNSMDS